MTVHGPVSLSAAVDGVVQTDPYGQSVAGEFAATLGSVA
jgi:hypothetical protein